MIKNLPSLQARTEVMTDIYKVAMLASPVVVAYAADVREALTQTQRMQDALSVVTTMCMQARVQGDDSIDVDSIEQTIKIFMEEAK